MRDITPNRKAMGFLSVSPLLGSRDSSGHTDFLLRSDDLCTSPLSRQIRNLCRELPCQHNPPCLSQSTEAQRTKTPPTLTLIRSTSLSISLLYLSPDPALSLPPPPPPMSRTSSSSPSPISKIPPPPGVLSPLGNSSTALDLSRAD